LEDRRILIDTSVVIDHFRKKNKHKSLLYELAKENILFLSAISKFEFLVGESLSKFVKQKKLLEAFIFYLSIRMLPTLQVILPKS